MSEGCKRRGIKARQIHQTNRAAEHSFLNIEAGTLTVAELIWRITTGLVRRLREFQETHNENLSRYPRRGNANTPV